MDTKPSKDVTIGTESVLPSTEWPLKATNFKMLLSAAHYQGTEHLVSSRPCTLKLCQDDESPAAEPTIA